MEVRGITIYVDAEAARIYESAISGDRQKIDAILSLRLNDLGRQRRSLEDVMADISQKAKARGLTVTDSTGKVTFKNAFGTNHLITKHNVQALVVAAQSRWKVENKNKNTLKIKGYHLDHGNNHLFSLLATFNILISCLFSFILFLKLSIINTNSFAKIYPLAKLF